MAQEYIDHIDMAIEVLVAQRRDSIASIAGGYHGEPHRLQMIGFQEAIEALQRARKDEITRMSSVYEERGILSA